MNNERVGQESFRPLDSVALHEAILAIPCVNDIGDAADVGLDLEMDSCPQLTLPIHF